jgi:uncharacterized protein (DUF4415 family)
LKRDSERLAAVRDEDIDYSDIPELTEEELNSLRPVKQKLTIRLDADVLDWLKSKGGAYQTRINRMLRTVMERQARSAAKESKR